MFDKSEKKYFVKCRNYTGIKFQWPKVLLKHKKITNLIIIYACFHTTTAELSSFKRLYGLQILK